MSPDMEKILGMVDDLRETMNDASITKQESFDLVDVLNDLIDDIPF